MKSKKVNILIFTLIGLITIFFLIYAIFKLNPYSRAGYYYKHNQYEKAIKLYQKALKLNPEHSNSYYNMGSCYYNVGLYDEAKECFEKSISIKPTAKAYNKLGIMCQDKEEYGEAISLYQNGINLNPNISNLYYNLGNVYKEQKDYEKAILYYKQSLRKDAEFSHSYYKLGVIYFQKKEFDLAINYYRKAIKHNFNFADAYKALGFAYSFKGDKDSAIKAFKKGIKIKPDSFGLAYLAGLYIDIKVYNEAEKIYKKALDKYFDSPWLLNGLAYLYLKQNINIDEAFSLAQKANNLKPNDYNIIDTLAFAYYRKGQYDKAIPLYEKALTLNNTIGEIHLHLALAYLKNNQTKEAVEEVKKAIELDEETINVINEDKNYQEIKDNLVFKNLLNVK